MKSQEYQQNLIVYPVCNFKFEHCMLLLKSCGSSQVMWLKSSHVVTQAMLLLLSCGLCGPSSSGFHLVKRCDGCCQHTTKFGSHQVIQQDSHLGIESSTTNTHETLCPSSSFKDMVSI